MNMLAASAIYWPMVPGLAGGEWRKGCGSRGKWWIGSREFEEIKRGYVAFVWKPKSGKISGKRKIKTGKLDFYDVYFVKELKFNLLSVSQMCDKKNNVLFTNTECVVLSSDFKLPDENHVLLRVPRENNMYNVDLKNVVPSEDLTCVFAEATLDESNIWHRRLGHINFKTMNKLVNGNLVRGLPSKIFENNHTCVACLKGKQHRASCKSKPVSSTSQPLQMLHMDLFRPTFVKSINKKSYCLVVTDDYNSKAFRVFNSRTRIVQETLHINFLGNKPNVIGVGPKWMFDINTLTMSMNYQPVVTENQLNDNEGIKENLDARKVGKETVSAQQYVLLPLRSTGSQDLHNTDDDVSNAIFDVKVNENDVHVSANESDKTDNKKHDEKAKRDDKRKSPVDSPIRVKDLRAEFEEFSFNSTNKVNVVSAPVTGAGPNSPNSTNCFSTASPFDNDVISNFEITGKSSFVDPSKYPNNPDMPKLEDIIYSDDEEDGHTQEEGIDYDEVFAPVARIEAIRLFSAYASFMGFMVYKVVKALYGLHQALRTWYETLANYLLEIGFQRGKIDKTLFIKKQKGDILLVQVYVNDIIFGSTNKELCKAFEKLMKDKFQRSSMGELTFFLGLQVKQKDDGIFISQDKYVAKILRKFGFTYVKSASTLIETKKPLLKDPDGEDMDVHIYRLMIGSLMYLTSSRPDIMFGIYACARFQVTPKVSHLHAIKRIFRYLKGKPHLGLWYPRYSPFNLVGYTDSDYDGASLDRKSTIRCCQFLEQTASGKDLSNPLIADSLLKNYMAINSPCCYNELTIPKQMDIGKEISNPFMA
nr:hypothetical protein [Tanacetum cinerariifolium]